MILYMSTPKEYGYNILVSNNKHLSVKTGIKDNF